MLLRGFGWGLHQIDVKSVFLDEALYGEIYMQQLLGFVTNSRPFCQLKKSLYGLKQAPHAWYEKNDPFFINNGFKHCECDRNAYGLHVHGDSLIVALHVNDLVITGNTVNLILGLKSNLQIPKLND